jgi:hypothetical protein
VLRRDCGGSKGAVPGDDDELGVVDRGRGCEVHRVVAAQRMALGKFSRRSRKRVVESDHVQFATQLVDRLDRGPQRARVDAAIAPRCRRRRSASLLGDEVRHRRRSRKPLAAPDPPLRPVRLLHEPTRSQLGEGVAHLERREPRDALATHRHDDLSACGGVPYVATELIVQLAHADLGLQLYTMWRHAHQLDATDERPQDIRADSRDGAGGSRTRTSFRTVAFEATASAIPPPPR